MPKALQTMSVNQAIKSENRTFSVSPSIIYALIKAQAGTLGKAVLECVMNSIDAGASKVDITVTHNTLSVVDDGRGFETRDEILSCFEDFGFEHHEGDRAYGQFCIGRAQLWNFCRTHWRTQTFGMDVDIQKDVATKSKKLGYVLEENLPKAAKCSFQTGLNAQRSPRRKPSGLVGGERPQPIMLPVLFVPGCIV